MALTNEEIIEALGEKTLLELAELRDMICEKFGVTATAAVAVAAGDGAAAAAEEKTEFDVVLEGFGDNRLVDRWVMAAVNNDNYVDAADAYAACVAIIRGWPIEK